MARAGAGDPILGLILPTSQEGHLEVPARQLTSQAFSGRPHQKVLARFLFIFKDSVFSAILTTVEVKVLLLTIPELIGNRF